MRDYAYVILATVYLAAVVGWCIYGPLPIDIYGEQNTEVTE